MLPEKGFDLIIKAFNLLEPKDKYRVIMGGSGPDQAAETSGLKSAA